MINIDKDTLYNLYWNNSLSAKEIGNKYKCTEANIRYYMRKFNIKRRGSKEKLDLFYTKNTYKPNLNPNLEFNYNMFYILGVLYGDGWVSKNKYNYKIGLSVTEYNFSESFYNSLKLIGLNPIRYKRQPRNIKHKLQYVIEANSVLFYNWYRSLKIINLYSLIANNYEYAIQFIRGMFESEGSLNKRSKNSWKIVIYNIDKVIVDLITYCLDVLKFKYNIYDFQPKVKNTKRMYPITLLGGTNETQRFINLIDPVIKKEMLYVS